ncbi:hypothetical protein GCM10028777_09520 [Angustibacter speluncae]
MSLVQVLQATLETQHRASVRLRLRSRDDGGGWVGTWTAACTPEELGLPTMVRGEPLHDSGFHLPAHVVRELPHVLSRGARVTWMQLCEPFGYLGMVPWEALLAPHVPGALVRLPTIDLAARTPSSDLQVAVLAVPPDPERPGTAGEVLHGMRLEASSRLRAWTHPVPEQAPLGRRGEGRRERPAEARLTAADVDVLVTSILHGSPRRTTVHVVTTPLVYHGLRAMWRGRRWPVRLHDPRPGGGSLGHGRRRTAPADWFAMVTAAMGGEQADVVHLVCGATVSGNRVRLALADPPEGGDGATSRFVSLSLLRGFLDGLGAWCVHLSAAPGDRCVPALRMAASRLLEERPGPVSFTDLGRDLDASDVRGTYAFLCRQDPALPPRHPDSLLACEPYRVRGAGSLHGGPHTTIEAPAAARPTGAIDAIIHDEETPAWVAAAQRFIEQRHLELARLRRDAPVGSSTPESRSAIEGIEEAIADLTAVIEQWAAEQREPS